MNTVKNYIFDLYGTLIDIRTDEYDPLLWSALAGFYSRFGADYSPDALRDAYHRTVRGEQERIAREKGVQYPEIKLETVFLRLLREAPGTHPTELAFGCDGEKIWTQAAANLFRELSVRRFRVFPGVHETLQKLRARGARLYLLSNAQRVFTMPEIEKAGLRDCFDAIYISSDFGAAKPEPAFLRALLREQDLSPDDCVLVGNDVRSDMAVARSCGVRGVLLNTDRRDGAELDALCGEGAFEVIRSGWIGELAGD